MDLNDKFEVVETCKGSKENCDELDYTITLTSSNGELLQQGGTATKAIEITGSVEEVNNQLRTLKFKPSCDNEVAGSTTVVVDLKARGPYESTSTQSELKPGGTPVQVKGTSTFEVYYASHMLNTFNLTPMKLKGRLIDNEGLAL